MHVSFLCSAIICFTSKACSPQPTPILCLFFPLWVSLSALACNHHPLQHLFHALATHPMLPTQTIYASSFTHLLMPYTNSTQPTTFSTFPLPALPLFTADPPAPGYALCTSSLSIFSLHQQQKAHAPLSCCHAATPAKEPPPPASCSLLSATMHQGSDDCSSPAVASFLPKPTDVAR